MSCERGAFLPTATYRLQLHSGFPFTAAAGVLDYLVDLGVSHVYCSPVLAAARGSTHGYDVVDPGRLNPELGGQAGWDALVTAATERGLGLVIDVVPNHMSVADPAQNAWWWDVLRRGRDSSYFSFFDIEQAPRLLLPVLADAAAAAELRVEDGELRYYDARFPLAPGTGAGTAQEVHAGQHYELADWRRGNAELGYRRFFDVSGLAGVRVEDPQVFDATHQVVTALVRSGDVSGLRIDHPDGLADPAGYLDRLAAATGGCWTVVEKILEMDEELPPTWQTAGTTGYDSLRRVDGVLLDPAGEAALTAQWVRISEDARAWSDLVHDLKLDIARGSLAAETARLARLGADPEAIAETLACFPVYRSYLPEYGAAHVERALTEAGARRPELGPALLRLRARLLDAADPVCRRFQQTSGMVMAKGVEDTAFYRYHRLVSLNEVGGDPSVFGCTVEEFHTACRRQEERWPATMTTLTTHDTKRSEDVRTRIGLLSEVADAWGDAVERLERAAAAHSGGVDAATRYLAHQTLVGAWPISADRFAAYLLKATREAKQYTSWTDPEPDYDAAVGRLAHGMCTDGAYIAELEDWLSGLAAPASATRLAHKLLGLCLPGIPDVYQGREAHERSLVDPDNRRPVDFAALTGFGDTKQQVTRAVLHARRQGWLAPGSGYQPLETGSPHALAFHRGPDAIVLVGRWHVALHRDARLAAAARLSLPPGQWEDRLGGTVFSGSVALADLAPGAGGALLIRTGAAPDG